MPTALAHDTLAEIPLFQGLTGEELARIDSLLHVKQFAAGTNILTVDQPGEVVYLILDGTVKVHVEQIDGSDVILAILGEGEIVGEMSLVDKLGRSATAVTLEDSTLLWMDRGAFEGCLTTFPVMNTNVIRILSRRLRLANEHIQALATLDVFGRVARQILAFGMEYGVRLPDGAVHLPLRMTQSDLAGLVGASRVRVNQVLVFYRQRNYISMDQNFRITVHNWEALAQRCQ